MKSKSENFVSVILIIIIVVGFFGNLLNIIVLVQKSMRKVSTFRFLFYLSIIDLLVLLVCAKDTLLKFEFYVDIKLKSLIICKIHSFLIYFLTHMSSIVLTMVNIERASIVCNRPLIDWIKRKTTKYFSKKEQAKLDSDVEKCLIFRIYKTYRVEVILIIIVLIIGLINIHFLFYMSISKPITELDLQNLKNLTYFNNNDGFDKVDKLKHEKLNELLLTKIFLCFPSKGTSYHYFLNNFWTLIDTFIYSVIPFFFMVLSSLAIWLELRRQIAKISKTIGIRNKIMMNKKVRKNRQLLIMLTCTNSYFVFCSFPYFSVFHSIIEQKFDSGFVQILLHVLSYSNNSVNFIFFGLFSTKYRETLRSLFQ